MTAIPIPPVSRCENGLLSDQDNEEMFAVEKIKKNLERDFATPKIIRKKISRLSQCMQAISCDYIQVHLRLRPFSDEETKANEDQGCMKISTDHHVLTLVPPKDSNMYKVNSRGIGDSVHHYTFSKIFDHTTQQKDLFEKTTLPLVEDFVNGNDTLVFTYGVTNAGKTYTIQGSPGNEGILPRSIDVIFSNVGDKLIEHDKIQLRMANDIYTASEDELKEIQNTKQEILLRAEQVPCENKPDSSRSSLRDTLESLPSSDITQSDCDSADNTVVGESSICSQSLDALSDASIQGPVKYAVFVSFIEIYKEFIYDLTSPFAVDKRVKRKTLRLADDKKGAPYVKGVNEIQVNSRDEVQKILALGRRNQHVAATKLNEKSSRSHCIFTLTLVQVTDVPNPKFARVSKISFCDLAGSERTNKTREDGIRLKEASNINNSLMKLGMCIEALRHNQTHRGEKQNQRVVPFRESKLTRLFQNFLLGQGRACMIVNANMCASSFDETVHVLRFSAVTKEVQTINKAKESVAVKKSRATMVSESREKMAIATKKPRATICWEFGGSTPIREEEEEESDVEDSDTGEEDSEEESESEEETKTEKDVEYWRERELKFREIIDMLKDELIKKEKKHLQSEIRARVEVAESYRNRIVEIEKDYEGHIEDTIEIMEDEQRTRLESLAKYSSAKLKQVQDQFEKKNLELVMHNKNLEKQLQDTKELLENHTSKERDLTGEVTSTKLEIESLKLDLAEMKKENSSLKRDVTRSRRSTTLFEQNEFIEELQQQNEEGRGIIQSQMVEMEEIKDRADKLEEEMDKTKKEKEKLQECAAESEKAFEKLAEESNECKMWLEKSENDIVLLKEQISALEKEREDLKRSLSDTEQNRTETFAVLETENDSLKKEITRLKAEDKSDLLKEKNEELCLASKRIDELENEVKTQSCNLEEKTSEAEKANEELGNGIEMKEDAKKKTIEELSLALKRVDELETDNHKLESELQQKESTAQKVKVELERQTEAKEKAMVEHGKAEQELQSKSARIESLSEDLELMKDKIEKLKASKEVLDTESVDLREELEKKDSDLKLRTDTYEEEKKTLLSKLEDMTSMKAETEELKEQVGRLEKDLDEAKKLENQFIKVEHGKAEQELQSKSAQIESLSEDLELMKDKIEKLKASKEALDTESVDLREELEKKDSDLKLRTAVYEEEKKTLLSKLEDMESMKAKTGELNEQVVLLKKDLDEAQNFEKQFIKEIDRLHSEAENLKKVNMSIKEASQKRTSAASDLMQDVNVLTLERNDLLERVETLRQELSKVKQEKETLESQERDLIASSSSVKNNTEIENLKAAMLEMDRTQNEQQALIEKYESEKECDVEERKNLQDDVAGLQVKIQDLEERNKTITESRDEAEHTRSKIAEVLNEKNTELANIESTCEELKGNLKASSARELDEKKAFREQFKAVESSLKEQIEELKRKVRASEEAKETEMKKFREDRDRIVAALDIQIKNLKSSNETLKANLDEQMSKNVQLQSQNARYMAENSHLLKQQEHSNKRAMRTSVSASALFSVPVVVLKKEPLFDVEIQGIGSAVDPPLNAAVTENQVQQDSSSEKDAENNKENEMDSQEHEKPKRGAKRNSSRGGQTGRKTSTRRKRTNPRPATPISEVGVAINGDSFDPDDEKEEDASDPPSRITRSSRARAKRSGSTRSAAVKNESQSNEDGVLDDSELMRVTGQSRDFPESTMELDVTPQVSKKATRGRKRAAKNKDEDYMPDDGTTTRNKSSRCKNNANNNSDKNYREEEDLPATATLKNLSKVGGMLKNSPVGQALKRIESAISPARQPAKPTIELATEQSQRRTRRVKLRAGDISSPLEAASTPEEPISDKQFVAETPARVMKRLRRRK